jgi:hypothetical protein
MTDKHIVEFPKDVWVAPTLTEDLRPNIGPAFIVERKKMADLTPAWFQGAMTPRHQPDGSVLRTLTPPRRAAGLPVGVILLIIVLLSCAAFVWGIVR